MREIKSGFGKTVYTACLPCGSQWWILAGNLRDPYFGFLSILNGQRNQEKGINYGHIEEML